MDELSKGSREPSKVFLRRAQKKELATAYDILTDRMIALFDGKEKGRSTGTLSGP